MTIELHIARWGVGTTSASLSLNGMSSGSLRISELNSCDFVSFLAMLSTALRPGDALRVFLPKPTDRVGMNEFDLGWFHRLAARGVEVCALDSRGTLHRIGEYDDLPAHEDMPPPTPLPTPCVRLGRHTWDDDARPGDLCLCKQRILRSSAHREAAL
jgi:hypothetical protein